MVMTPHGVTTNGAGLRLTWTIWGCLEVVAASGAGRVRARLRAVLDGFLRAIGGAKMGFVCVLAGSRGGFDVVSM